MGTLNPRVLLSHSRTNFFVAECIRRTTRRLSDRVQEDNLMWLSRGTQKAAIAVIVNHTIDKGQTLKQNALFCVINHVSVNRRKGVRQRILSKLKLSLSGYIDLSCGPKNSLSRPYSLHHLRSPR